MARLGIILSCILLTPICLTGCTTSAPAHDNMISYNGEWITVQEYEQIKIGEVPASSEEAQIEQPISFQISNIDQNCYDDLDKWDVYVRFELTVKNMTSTAIRYYEVAITAECAGGEEFHNWTNGSDLAAGATETKDMVIYVDSLKVVAITVDDWGLNAYSVSHEETAPDLELSASFSIDDWSQEYYEPFDQWGLARVYYDMKNTGDLDIDYYEVYIDIICYDGETFHEWTTGEHVGIGRTDHGSMIVDTYDREVKSAKVVDWELRAY